MEELQLWMSYISDYGYPAVVSFYLLVKFERKIGSLTKIIEKMENSKK